MQSVDGPGGIRFAPGVARSAKSSSSRSLVSGPIWLWAYLSRHKRVFIPSLIALFLTAGLSLAFPWFLKELIGDPADALRNGVDPQAVLAKSNRVVVSLLCVLVLQAFVAFWRVRGFIHSGEAALNDLRKDLFAHLVRLPMPFFQEQRSGALSNRVSSDLGVVRDTLMNTVPQAARQTVILIGGMIVIFVASWKLSLIMLGCVPLVVLALAIFGRKVKHNSKAAQDALAEASTVVEETVQGIADVKSFGNESLELARYGRSLDHFYDVTKRGALARAGFLSFIIFALFGTIAIVVWFGSRMLATGEIDSRQFVTFILFSIFVGASLGAFPEIVTQLQAMSGATERLRELMAMEGERSTGKGSASLGGALAFDNVRFRYPSRPDVEVLQGVDFQVAPGKRVALVGPSGAGKSTVFSLILGFHHPESGRVLFDGFDAESMTLESLRNGIAIVPQEVLLFGGSIRENIAYGRPGATQQEIEEAARQANAHDFIAALPEGYDTLVGPRGVKMSGGQRQRLAIARAILANPRILLLDEATSALDAESERLVNEALERLMQGRTSLVIAHRLSTVRHADRILVFNHGKVVESGTHDELMDHNGTYRLLAETQLS